MSKRIIANINSDAKLTDIWADNEVKQNELKGRASWLKEQGKKLDEDIEANSKKVWGATKERLIEMKVVTRDDMTDKPWSLERTEDGHLILDTDPSETSFLERLMRGKGKGKDL